MVFRRYRNLGIKGGLLLLAFLLLPFGRIEGGFLQAQTIGDEQGYFCNPPLPYLPYKLDVLFIGNSFSIDACTALPNLLRSAKLSTVAVYVLYKGGCSMKQHYEYYLNNEPVYELWMYDSRGEKKLESKTTIRSVMRRLAYDVVVFQQYSLESGNYESYEPYMSKVLQAYKVNTISPRTTFAFNQTWAYSSRHKDLKRYGTQEDMWRKICQACSDMKKKSGVDIIIPCGTAVQNARSLTTVSTENEWTRDNQHISTYQGRYLLACTVFESIIAPCFNVNLSDDRTNYGKKEPDIVNDANRRRIQRCAKLAVANNYNISEFVNEE